MVGDLKSITLLCQTIGRPSLAGTIWSWVAQNRIPTDRLLIYGNGLLPTIPVVSGVEGFKCPLIGDGNPDHFPGLLHLDVALQGGVPGDYVMHIDDDDMLVWDAFKVVRPLLDGEAVVAIPPWYSATSARSFFPNKPPFPIYGATGDGEFYTNIIRGAKRMIRIEQEIVVRFVGRYTPQWKR